MEEIYSAGVQPSAWKVQGVPTAKGSKAIGDVASITSAGCLVLGQGADAVTVSHWLRLAGSTDGYKGFAIGRTIWRQLISDWKRYQDDDRIIAATAENYRQLIDAYRAGAGAASVV
jgi:myo-inositol catabolism protein IolC